MSKALAKIEAARKAWRTRRRKEETGTVSVYVCHAINFGGTLRPAYDTAPDCRGDLTLREASQLRAIISRYVGECIERRK